jgi:hypothetical protein
MAYLYTAWFPTELHLAELAFANGVAKYILAKPGLLLAPRMVMPTPRSMPWFFTMRSRSYDRRRSSIVIVKVRHMVRLRQFLTLPFALDVNLRWRYQNTVQDLASLS